MKHTRAQSIDDLVSLVNGINEKLKAGNKGNKVDIKPVRRKQGVSVRFEFNLPSGRKRLSVTQMAKKNYNIPDADFELYPELSTDIYNSNADKLDKVKDLWLKVSAMNAEGILIADSLQLKKSVYLFDYIEAIDKTIVEQGKVDWGKKSLLKHLKLSGCGDRLLGNVDAAYCQRFYDYLVNRSGLKDTTQKNIEIQLHIILNKATIDDNLIDFNPCDKVPKQYRPKNGEFDNSRHLSKNQLNQLEGFFHRLPVPETPKYGPNGAFSLWEATRIFLFACYTGLRISDIEQLTADFIVSDGNKVHISKEIQKTHNHTFKTLHKKAIALLSLYENKNTLFFPMSRSTLRDYIKKAIKAANITLHFSPSIHTARHTFATLLAEGGASTYTIQFQLDHKSPAMAERYIGITQKMVDDSLKALD
ncbi:MAG: integrase catalytic domain-containing protein [Salinivirgaceae bacterium]|nr:integrase catalytic domain-containing protein [Salinivirgaceae bacterium]